MEIYFYKWFRNIFSELKGINVKDPDVITNEEMFETLTSLSYLSLTFICLSIQLEFIQFGLNVNTVYHIRGDTDRRRRILGFRSDLHNSLHIHFFGFYGVYMNWRLITLIYIIRLIVANINAIKRLCIDLVNIKLNVFFIALKALFIPFFVLYLYIWSQTNTNVLNMYYKDMHGFGYYGSKHWYYSLLIMASNYSGVTLSFLLLGEHGHQYYYLRQY